MIPTQTLVIAYGFGLISGVIAPLILMPPTLRLLWWQVADHNGIQRTALLADVIFLPALVGLLERLLYIIALLAKSPEFIGVWLALKVAGGWSGWSGKREYKWDDNGKEILGYVPGRQEFNLFLVGTALSLIFAVAGAFTIQSLIESRIRDTLLINGATFVLAVSLLIWARMRMKHQGNSQPIAIAATPPAA
jgi:hypothetical protein